MKEQMSVPTLLLGIYVFALILVIFMTQQSSPVDLYNKWVWVPPLALAVSIYLDKVN